ncbi:MAG TPA: exonuclease SbcCD subunit D [Actinobacteria bacterium]|nr:exonuclease SbcCD subunit D [Actinomycetota bacterium]
MKIIHISDTHLGYTAYGAVNKESGIKQREIDVCEAFKQAIEKIIEISPDIVLHCGDLFDNVRPSNRILTFALEQLLRLQSANIPVVLIAGNHSMPRMRDVGSIFRIFELFPGLYPIYKGKYEKLSFNNLPGGGHGLTVHTIPHCLTKEDFDKNLKELKIDQNDKYNVLMLHAAAKGIKEFSMGEFNEQTVETSYFKPEFDYIALGHYHKHTQLAENAYYSGSTERFSFNEAGQEKGFLEIDLSTKKTTFHSLKIRSMVEIKRIDAAGKDADFIMERIEEAIMKNEIEGKIAKLEINGLSGPTYNVLDFKQIKHLTSPALHFDIKYNRDGENESVHPSEVMQNNMTNLPMEFESYLEKTIVEKIDKKMILEMGKEYLKRAAIDDETG